MNLVNTDIREAVDGAEVISIPLPGFTISAYGRILAPLLTEDHIVVIMPGTLSALEFRETIRANGNLGEPIIAETGGLPFATRLIGPGKVKTFNIRSVCGLTAIPGNKGNLIHDKLKRLYPFDLKKFTLISSSAYPKSSAHISSTTFSHDTLNSKAFQPPRSPPPLPLHPSQSPAQPDDPRPAYIVTYFS